MKGHRNLQIITLPSQPVLAEIMIWGLLNILPAYFKLNEKIVFILNRHTSAFAGQQQQQHGGESFCSILATDLKQFQKE